MAEAAEVTLTVSTLNMVGVAVEVATLTKMIRQHPMVGRRYMVVAEAEEGRVMAVHPLVVQAVLGANIPLLVVVLEQSPQGMVATEIAENTELVMVAVEQTTAAV